MRLSFNLVKCVHVCVYYLTFTRNVAANNKTHRWFLVTVMMLVTYVTLQIIELN